MIKFYESHLRWRQADGAEAGVDAEGGKQNGD